MAKPQSDYVTKRLRAIEQERLAKPVVPTIKRPAAKPDDALDDEPEDFFAYIWPDLQ